MKAATEYVNLQAYTAGMILVIQGCIHTFEGKSGFTVALNSFGFYGIKLNVGLHRNIFPNLTALSHSIAQNWELYFAEILLVEIVSWT